MKELIGRLGNVDPSASETLKIVAYFDRLLEGHAGLDAFVRGAAALSGCPAGLMAPRMLTICSGPTGTRLPPPSVVDSAWPSKGLWHGSESVVWIQREGSCSSADIMVLERFAAGVRITLERIYGDLFDDHASVEMLLDATARTDARRRAAKRLRIDDRQPMRVVARNTREKTASLPLLSTVMDTPYGLVQATIELASSEPDHDQAAANRTGIGPWGDLKRLPHSWDGALIALRLTTDLIPVAVYEQLGATATLASLVDTTTEPYPDVQELAKLAEEYDWALNTLGALIERESVRKAAVRLGIHHSTLQARLSTLEAGLGYQISAPGAQLRLGITLALFHLSHNRFG